MSSTLPTVKIVHPEVPGEFCIINQSDYQDGVHTRWEDREKAPASGGSGGSTGDDMPADCAVEHRGGGRFIALFKGQPLKPAEGDQPAIFQGKAAAIEAVKAFAAAQAAAGGDGQGGEPGAQD